MRRSAALQLALALSLGACASLRPEPAPALEPVSDMAWTEWLSASGLVSETEAPPLWQRLDDPVFEELVAAALENNPNLAIMSSRLREARAMERADLAALGPQIALSGSASAQRMSENGTLPVGKIPGLETEQVLYDVGFDAGWELDLFGRNAVRTEAAEARTRRAEASLKIMRASLLADLTRGYLGLRGVQAERALYETILDRQRQLTDAIRVRRDAGEASDLDLLRAETQLAEFQSRLPSLDADIRGRIYQLAVLTGAAPSALDRYLEPAAGLPRVHQPLAVRISSQALRQRPDVREAEQAYVLAARQQDLAELDLYPSVMLVASAGPSATDLADILDPASLAGNVSALLDWTLFDGGRRDALADAAGEQRIQAELAYRASVLAAMEETEAAAARYAATQGELVQRRAVTAGRAEIARMAEVRFEGSTGTLLDVLETQRDAADAEIARVRTETRLLIEEVALEKAAGAWLGGAPRAFGRETG